MQKLKHKKFKYLALCHTIRKNWDLNLGPEFLLSYDQIQFKVLQDKDVIQSPFTDEPIETRKCKRLAQGFLNNYQLILN